MSNIGVETTGGGSATGVGGPTTSPTQSSTNLIDYYRFLNPQDALGKMKLPVKKNGLNEPGSEKFQVLFDTYIKSTLSGKQIIKKLGPLTGLPYRGLGYMTAAIDTTGNATFLDREYWFTKSTIPSKSDEAETAGKETSADAYYQNICTMNEEPTTAITLNVFRMPFLSDCKKSVDDIDLFLNHIPSYFASQMVPYFDFEMEMPRHAGDTVKDPQTQKIIETYLDRPSLLKFLLGSNPKTGGGSGDLSDPDKALMSTLNVPAAHQVVKNGPAPGLNSGGREAYITGMEMFTTPQTLTNMATLKEDGRNRLHDVKPFLPPATLVSANISQQRLGISATRTATVDLVIHDKSRLAEFSEFVRGQSGSADITFWITYGWLAPRGVADTDAYSKFINETMLVKQAFMVKNVTYSFDAQGQVKVSLSLVTKAVTSAEYGRIDTLGTKESSVFVQLPRALAEIRRNRTALNGSGTADRDAASAISGAPGAESLGLKESRIFEIIEAAASGDLNATNIPREELIKTLVAEGKRIEQEKPFNEKADRLIQLLLYVYGYDPNTKGPALESKIKTEASSFAKSRFDSFRREGEDPFLPDDRTVKRGDDENRIFSEDLVKAMRDYGEEGKPKETPPQPGRGGGGGGGAYAACPGEGGRNTFWKINTWWGKYITDAEHASSKKSVEVRKYKDDQGKEVVFKDASYSKLNEEKLSLVTIEVPGYGPMTHYQIISSQKREAADLRACFEKHNVNPQDSRALGDKKSAESLTDKTAKDGKINYDAYNKVQYDRQKVTTAEDYAREQEERQRKADRELSDGRKKPGEY